ncbi:MAG TPA: hypothetical protein VI669_00755, partial [Vicinamibacteria bacterium]
AQAAPSGARVVPREEILDAMRTRQGYDLTATTNGARFQAEVLRALLRRSRARDPDGALLFLGHAAWFAAYLERTGLSPHSAPPFIRLADQHGQDLEIDARAGQVVERVIAGPAPRLAANVRIGWPAGRGGRDRYSYDDTLSIPDLRVTNERIITYRLLDFGDLVVYDEVQGLRGRPTEGVLGVLFELIGEGGIEWSRMAISADGLQVSRARAGKGFINVESSLTVFPDGRVEKDLPKGRPDLIPLDKRVRQPLRIRYRPFDRRHAPREATRLDHRRDRGEFRDPS